MTYILYPFRIALRAFMPMYMALVPVLPLCIYIPSYFVTNPNYAGGRPLPLECNPFALKGHETNVCIYLPLSLDSNCQDRMDTGSLP